ncbi:type II toxin-antitoxin system VapC family toxin [soil metagenome]
MEIYLDTSVLVAIYVPEPHTENILAYLDENITKIFISRLTETEFHSALAIKLRTKQLTAKQVTEVTNVFNENLETFIYEKIFLSDNAFQQAINFLTIHKTNLRTLDALHLASANTISANLLTSDQDLAKAADYFNIPCKLL